MPNTRRTAKTTNLTTKKTQVTSKMQKAMAQPEKIQNVEKERAVPKRKSNDKPDISPKLTKKKAKKDIDQPPEENNQVHFVEEDQLMTMEVQNDEEMFGASSEGNEIQSEASSSESEDEREISFKETSSHDESIFYDEEEAEADVQDLDPGRSDRSRSRSRSRTPATQWRQE